MKTNRIAILSLVILGALLFGAIAANVISPRPELKLKAKWKPAAYMLDSGPPNPWNVELYFAPPRPVGDINPSTLLLEGMYTPLLEEYPPYITPKERLNVSFSGWDVFAALMAKAPHMAPGTYEIFLEITGQLYDDTPFRGSGSITLTIPDLPPP